MRKTLTAAVLAAAMAMQAGCASYMVAKGSQERVMQRRAINAHAVDGGAAISVDLLSLDVIGERPWLQAGAALLDAAMIYGTYTVADKYLFNNDRSHRSDSSRRAEIVIRGDGNMIIYQEGGGQASRDTTTTTTSGGAGQ